MVGSLLLLLDKLIMTLLFPELIGQNSNIPLHYSRKKLDWHRLKSWCLETCWLTRYFHFSPWYLVSQMKPQLLLLLVSKKHFSTASQWREEKLFFFFFICSIWGKTILSLNSSTSGCSSNKMIPYWVKFSFSGTPEFSHETDFACPSLKL